MIADMSKTLFKLNTNGSIQTWCYEISEDGKYRTHTGKDGGKIIVSEWTTCVQKNIGKANETSAFEQANKQAQALYTKQLSKGYKEDRNDISVSDSAMKPMLAEKYEDRVDFVHTNIFKDNVCSQPKLDGIRCVVNSVGMFTRNGKKIHGCEHIFRELEPLFKENQNLVFDGELYNHELKNDFPKIVSLTKKTKPTEEDIKECESMVQYHIYDCFMSDQEKIGFCFSERFLFLKNLLQSTLSNKKTKIKLVDTVNVSCITKMDDLMEVYLENGYEGQILRIADSEYQNKRTKSLLKRKVFDDGEFRIVDILEGEGNRSGGAGKLVFKHPNGNMFESGIRGNFQYFTDLLENKKEYIGKLATVRYFGLTPDGKPRFPVTVTIWGEGRDF